MEARNQLRNRRLAVVALFVLCIPFPLAFGHQTAAPVLDEILDRLESNLQRYDKQVPNFFCDEHVVSLLVYGKHQQSTVTDSVFRLKRVSGDHEKEVLSESRELKAVNGTPTEGADVTGPAVLGGVFSGGLNAVSLSQKACMRYMLQPLKTERADEPYVVQFESLPGAKHRSGCVLNEEGSGRVFIDRASMQVKRMELTVPDHVIMPATVGVWRISIDYSPVLLGDKTFWMPATIISTATASQESRTVWSFDARYSNYHKLEVTSRIVP